MSEAPLKLEKIVKEYGETIRTRVLHGVDLEIEPGQFAALIGPSGSGKSTLLNIMGLLDRPTSGRVIVDGRDTAGMTDREITKQRGRSLGFVFQFHHLLKAFTALENVAMPMLVDRGWPSRPMRTRAGELLERVGLGSLTHRKASELSGGQQQRVAIARALMLRPALLLADEPTGNLDTETSDEVFSLFREINKEEGTAFLIVTHDPRLAGRCDRVIRLVDGLIVDDAFEPEPDPCKVCGLRPQFLSKS